MDLVLRKMNENDLDFLFRENKGTVKAYFGGFTTREEAGTWIEEALKKIELGQKEEWVGEANGEPVAMIGINHIENQAHIGLWVAMDQQGKGIGKELLRKLVEKVRERGWPQELYYLADADNYASNALARSNGFSLKSLGEENEYFLEL